MSGEHHGNGREGEGGSGREPSAAPQMRAGRLSNVDPAETPATVGEIAEQVGGDPDAIPDDSANILDGDLPEGFAVRELQSQLTNDLDAIADALRTRPGPLEEQIVWGDTDADGVELTREEYISSLRESIYTTHAGDAAIDWSEEVGGPAGRLLDGEFGPSDDGAAFEDSDARETDETTGVVGRLIESIQSPETPAEQAATELTAASGAIASVLEERGAGAFDPEAFEDAMQGLAGITDAPDGTLGGFAADAASVGELLSMGAARGEAVELGTPGERRTVLESVERSESTERNQGGVSPGA